MLGVACIAGIISEAQKEGGYYDNSYSFTQDDARDILIL
jgi:hypothetical protein